MIVLTYHRVANPHDNPCLDTSLISATPSDFEWQMEYLAAHYQVISIDEVLAAVETGRPLSSRAVLITFDDAYRDFAENAWPVLRRYGMPVILFVPTAFPACPERSFWWDTLYHAITFTPKRTLLDSLLGLVFSSTERQRLTRAKEFQRELKTLPHFEAMARIDCIIQTLGVETHPRPNTLTWDELRCLAEQGVALGAHTQTHPILTQMAPEEVRKEIRGSQNDLAREIGTVRPVFSFPSGENDRGVVEILKQEGFKAAFTTLDGQNDLRTQDPLRLCRTNITCRTTRTLFPIRLWRWFSQIDRLRHSCRTPILTTPRTSGRTTGAYNF
jgi:peptidoglycan/xylan/chitin deacetylase (PgdA/CDA1 family)